MLEAMKNHQVTKLIFASSSSVYGGSNRIPFVETDPVDRPISPYAATKRTGELLCALYSRIWNLDVACLRLFATYGPRQRPEMAIHTFIRQLSEGKKIQVFGDSTTARDYTYVDDIIDGILRAIDRVRGFEIYNLGGSKSLDLHEVIRQIQSVLGSRAAVEYLPARQGDMGRTVADLRKSREKLAYEPRVPFEEGIRSFVRWYQSEGGIGWKAAEMKI